MPSLQSHLSCNPACEDAQEIKLLGFDDVYEQIVMGSPESLFDLPPESFWVPKGSEQDWVHQNANMQRRTSMKLQNLQDGFSGADSKSQSHRSFSAVNKSSSSSSLLALPKPRNPKAAAGTRLFRSMSEPGGGGEMRVAELGSPKVSCTGRVRSTKKKEGGGGGRRTGFWRRFGLVLRSRFGTDRVASKRSGRIAVEDKIRRQSSL